MKHTLLIILLLISNSIFAYTRADINHYGLASACALGSTGETKDKFTDYITEYIDQVDDKQFTKRVKKKGDKMFNVFKQKPNLGTSECDGFPFTNYIVIKEP